MDVNECSSPRRASMTAAASPVSLPKLLRDECPTDCLSNALSELSSRLDMEGLPEAGTLDSEDGEDMASALLVG